VGNYQIRDPQGTTQKGISVTLKNTPTITISKSELFDMATKAADALIPLNLFNRGGQLVRPEVRGDETVEGGILRPPGALTLRPVSTVYMEMMLSEHANWLKPGKEPGKYTTAPAPTKVASALVDSPDVFGFRELCAVSTIPLLLPSGEWLGTSGWWDGVYLDLGSTAWKEPSDSPGDALTALAILYDLMGEFPFESETDRAVAASGFISACMAPVLKAIPMHCIDSPTPGTGKSLLVDGFATVVTGRAAPVANWPKDQGEGEKRLHSMFLSGDIIVALDNIMPNTPLLGASLCQAITQETIRVRLFHSQKTAEVPTRALIVATGNNLSLHDDLVRRSLVCRLDAKCEQPHLRTFKSDFLRECRKKRVALVWAVQSIVRANIDGERSNPLGSFEDWSYIVRDALVAAGGADPVASQEAVLANDTLHEEALEVLEAWWRAFKDTPTTVADAGDSHMFRTMVPGFKDDDGNLNRHQLGYWLRNRRGRVFGQYRLDRDHGATGNKARWIVSTPS
jgi:putative DNA primase/helicase